MLEIIDESLVLRFQMFVYSFIMYELVFDFHVKIIRYTSRDIAFFTSHIVFPAFIFLQIISRTRYLLHDYIICILRDIKAGPCFSTLSRIW